MRLEQINLISAALPNKILKIYLISLSVGEGITSLNLLMDFGVGSSNEPKPNEEKLANDPFVGELSILRGEPSFAFLESSPPIRILKEGDFFPELSSSKILPVTET